MYAHIGNRTWKEKGHQSVWERMVFIQYLMTPSTDATPTANSPETQAGWGPAGSVSQHEFVTWWGWTREMSHGCWIALGCRPLLFMQEEFPNQFYLVWTCIFSGCSCIWENPREVDILMTTYCWRSRRVSDISQVHLLPCPCYNIAAQHCFGIPVWYVSNRESHNGLCSFNTFLAI